MNRLYGSIAAIEAAGGIVLLDVLVDTRRYTATLIGANDEILEWRNDMPVTLVFKETEVSLAKGLSGLISMRNRLPGQVVAIERGRLLSRVTLDIGSGNINAVITTRSCDALELTIGDRVEGLVKANEMSVVPTERQS